MMRIVLALTLALLSLPVAAVAQSYGISQNVLELKLAIRLKINGSAQEFGKSDAN